jgi:hypothetical protein
MLSYKLIVIMLSVAFYLLLCWVSWRRFTRRKIRFNRWLNQFFGKTSLSSIQRNVFEFIAAAETLTKLSLLSQLVARMSNLKIQVDTISRRLERSLSGSRTNLETVNEVPLCSNSVAGSLNKRVMLSSSFRCDQIYKYKIYNFGHTLLCYLSQT